MLEQQALIARLRALCQADGRVLAATLYGSFAVGEGDAFSDIEAVLYFEASALAELDRRAWLSQVAPLLAFFPDDFGHYTAIFASLVRGEFHFEPPEKMASIANWQGNAWFPALDTAILVDRSGALREQMQNLAAPPPRATPANVERLVYNWLNLMLFGANVLARGEIARALELLSLVQRYLIWLARLDEGTTIHWPTPSRQLEHDLSLAAYTRLAAATAPLDAIALRRAYRSAWVWGRELAARLLVRHNLTAPRSLFDELGRRFNQSP